MTKNLKSLLAAPLLILAACGTPANEPAGADCGLAESFEANGNTYCVATRAIIEKGFECPPDMHDLDFGEVSVCSPNEMVPPADLAPLYEHVQDEGGTGDPLDACEGPNLSAGDQCNVDADCGVDERCVIVDENACLRSSCVCDASTGAWGCTEDCQAKTECQAIGDLTCTTDEECRNSGDGELCMNGECVTPNHACTTNEECPNGTQCDQGQCVPLQSGCQTDADCDAGDVCLSGSCQALSCRTNEECPNGMTCEQGECTLLQACQNDGECEGNDVCVQGMCQDGLIGCGPDPSEQACSTDEDCGAGQACVASDADVCIPSTCVCDQATLTWACSEDCNDAFVCAPTSDTSCTTDADCGENEVCNSGICFAR